MLYYLNTDILYKSHMSLHINRIPQVGSFISLNSFKVRE